MDDGDSQVTHKALPRVGSPRVVTTPGAPAGPARVVVLAGDLVGRKFIVDGPVVFGRSSSSTIQIDDGLVSRHHARITRESDGSFVIEDLGSRNGTIVDGVPVASMNLKFGARIHIGSCLLLFTHYDPLEEQVVQRQKLEAVGRLGTGIAHDFNNLLAAIMSSLDYIDVLDPTEDLSHQGVGEALADIRLAAVRATEMTRRLLGFARRSHRAHGAVDLGALCDEAVVLTRRSFKRLIEIEVDLAPALRVAGDRVQLHQLLMNLLINARDAMPEGGLLRISGRAATEEELVALHRQATTRHVVLTVSDTGMGMPPEVQKHAFEPFFTTKSGDAGAGLGLSTVYEVASAHGGHIELSSEPDKGTTFQIYLPAATHVEPIERPVTLDQSDLELDLTGEPLTILLVDDEDVVRRSARRALRQSGHTVIGAEDGYEAVELYEAADPRPDLVLLDLDMPKVTGNETFRLLRKVDPDVSVIFVSGYWEREAERTLRAEGALAFVQKPYDARTLHEAILTALVHRAARKRR